MAYVPEPVIVIRQQRPSYYPDIYTGIVWSWKRQRLLYEIHATNRLEYLDLNTLWARLQWFAFRLKLSTETAKWLLYAIIRGKSDMVIGSGESITPYDLCALRVFRSAVQRTFPCFLRHSN